MFSFYRCSLLLLLGPFTVFAQTRMISHLTNPSGGFSSTLILENNAPISESVTLTPYDALGNGLGPVTLQLDSGTVLVRDATDLFAGAASHFEIAAGEDDVVRTQLRAGEQVTVDLK